MYLIIGIWGGANRIYATIKFVLYTLVGSLLMLVAILALAWTYQSATGTWDGAFDYEALVAFGFDHVAPVLGLPRVLPRVRDQGADVAVPHVATGRPHGGADGGLGHPRGRPAEARRATGSSASRCRSSPTPRTTSPGSSSRSRSSGCIYGAIVAVRQPDLKRLIAYSSVSHMGFVTLGIFVFDAAGPPGRRLPDGRPRHHHRRPLPARRGHLRAHPRPDDREHGRPRLTPAGLRDAARVLQPRVGRPARAGRLRGRVPRARRSASTTSRCSATSRPSRSSSRPCTCCTCSRTSCSATSPTSCGALATA